MKKNIILALDLDLKPALQISKELKDHIYGLKIGSLLTQIGIQGLKEFDAMNISLFIDQKYSDVPSTVARHIENFKNFKNIEFLTIHSLSSKAMIKEAVKAAENINKATKVLKNDILDIDTWIQDAVSGKISSSWKRMQNDWTTKLMNDASFTDPIPSNQSDFVDLVIAQPTYKNRKARDDG